MRKIFLFWAMIILILALGTAAIIYGKIRVKEEKKREYEIRKELSLPKVPRTLEFPKLPPEGPVEEAPIETEMSEEFPRPAIELPKETGDTALPEAPEKEVSPLQPETTEVPTLPEPLPEPLPAPIDIESSEPPELPVIPKMPPEYPFGD